MASLVTPTDREAEDHLGLQDPVPGRVVSSCCWQDPLCGCWSGELLRSCANNEITIILCTQSDIITRFLKLILFTPRPLLLQIVRTDLKELRDFDLEGAPYGYTPFCESRREMDGYRFWKSGYWASHLAGRKYHIRYWTDSSAAMCRINQCCVKSKICSQALFRSIFPTFMHISCVTVIYPLQCPVCGRPEEVQENSCRRPAQRTVPGAQPRPQQSFQPGPGLELSLTHPYGIRLTSSPFVFKLVEYFLVIRTVRSPDSEIFVLNESEIQELLLNWEGFTVFYCFV